MTLSRTQIAKRALLWCATLAWMILIFSLSAENAEESTQTSGGIVERLLDLLLSTKKRAVPDQSIIHLRYVVTLVVRKSAHFTAYLVLGVLFCCSLRESALTVTKASALALVMSSLYAVSDEVHQLFVPGRSGKAADVLLDSLGALVGILLVHACVRVLRSIKEKRHKIDAPQEIINE